MVYAAVSLFSMNLAVEVAKSIEGLEVEYVEISPLPFLNTDLEVNGTYPPLVEAFRLKILAADALLFASPDYNYSVSGNKNETPCFSIHDSFVFVCPWILS